MPTREEKNTFSMMIMTRADKDKTDCIDTIVNYCEEKNLEMETAASLVNDILKARLHDEAMSLNFIEKSSKLPI